MHDMAEDHEVTMQKKDSVSVDADSEIGVDRFPGSWDILCNKSTIQRV